MEHSANQEAAPVAPPSSQPASQPPNLPIMVDGQLVFGVRSPAGEIRQFTVDVMLAKVVIETVEDRNNLQSSANGEAKVTPECLIDLANEFAKIGVTDCSPSVAYQLWFAINNGVALLKKNMSEPQNLPTGSEFNLNV